jgi:hypothetical protein
MPEMGELEVTAEVEAEPTAAEATVSE